MQCRAFAASLVALALAAGPAASQTRTYKIIGVGDIMMGSDYPEPIMDPRVTQNAAPAAMVGAPLAKILAEADVTFGNMEGTLHSSNADAKHCKNPKTCYTFRSPPWHADVLKRLGFSMMSTANNHAGDFGAGGRAETYRNLTRAGIVAGGNDADGMRTGIQTLKDGTKVGLAAFGHNPGILTVWDLGRVAGIVRELKKQSDIVIVSCHAGGEGANATKVPRAVETFLGENRGDVFRFARTSIDAGGDVVLCHGPHVPRAVEIYKNRFIAYSLGNFWTYGRFNLKGNAGVAPVAEVEVDKSGRLAAARIISAKQDHPGGPQIDPSGAAARVIAELTARDFPEAGITIAADGRLSWPGKGR
jgi:hypothetical protein